MHRRHRPHTACRRWQPVARSATDDVGKVAIDVRHRHREPFGMRDGHPAQTLGLVIKPALAFFHDLRPATHGRMDQLVRLFGRPAEPTGFAKDLNVEPMLPPDGDRRCPKPPHRAARHAEVDHRVVFQHPAADGRGEIGRQPFHLVIADETGHVQRMDATIGELARHSGHGRVIAPAHTRVVGIGRVAVVAVAEVGDDQPHLADIARPHHGAGLPDHRIGRIAIVDSTYPARLRGNADDFFALFDGHRHRLFAQHMKPGL